MIKMPDLAESIASAMVCDLELIMMPRDRLSGGLGRDKHCWNATFAKGFQGRSLVGPISFQATMQSHLHTTSGIPFSTGWSPCGTVLVLAGNFR